MLQGFKEFISRGNAIDLAVGVVIGAAFGAITEAITNNFISPLIAGLFGTPSFDTWGQFQIHLFGDEPALVQPGVILTALVNFLIIAFAIYFFVVYPMNMLNKKKDELLGVEEKEDEVSPEVELLSQIRDELKKASVSGAEPAADATGEVAND